MALALELEDEEAKDYVQRKNSAWKELARHPDRVKIVLEKMLKHFLDHPEVSGIFNCGTGRSESFLQLAEHVAEHYADAKIEEIALSTREQFSATTAMAAMMLRIQVKSAAMPNAAPGL